MNYLVSVFDCVLFGEKQIEIKANAKYKLSDLLQEELIVFPVSSGIPFLFCLKRTSKNVLKVKSGNDIYFFLFPNLNNESMVTEFNYGAKRVFVSVSNKINISINGELVCEKNVENLKYSHFEILGELCLIYFEGERNYLVVLKEKTLCFANYYDEYNLANNEKYFMTKLNDSLNHGLVCHIKDKKFDSYLVYLDDEDLCLKDEFIPFVFLDCVKAKNYLYANFLLSEELKLEETKQVAEFFPDFDWFYPIENNKFILINKNTLAGVFEFVVDNNKISNIIHR